MRVVNAYATGSTITSFQRGEHGTLVRQTHPAPMSCFLRKEDFAPELRAKLTKHPYCRGFEIEGDWVRTNWRNRDALRAAAEAFASVGIKTFEADINPVRKWITDNDVQIARPRRAYLDFEADSRVPFSKLQNARILCWSLVDDVSGATTEVLSEDTDEAERALLASLWLRLERHDQVLAWNGDRYDFPLFEARSTLRGLHFEWKRWLWLDQLEVFKRMNAGAESGDEKQSLALNAVATALLGEGKADLDASKSWQHWEAGGESREALARYCEQDTRLLAKIEAKTGYVELLQTLCEACGVFPDSLGLKPTLQVEGFLLALAKQRGHRFPTWERKESVSDEEANPFRGAYVMDPDCKGIVKDVHVADFSRLYPSIIQTWNMSPETWRPEAKAVAKKKPSYLAHQRPELQTPEGTAVAAITEAVFQQEPIGLLPLAVGEMLRLRKDWDKKKAAAPPGSQEWVEANRKSAAYKIAANSFYGVVGSPFSRFFERDVAESVSQCGVWLIKQTIAEAERLGMKVIYGDTDSLFVTGSTREGFSKFVEHCNADLYPKLVAERGCARNEISLAYEKAFRRLVMTGKKRYCNPPEAPIWMGDLTFKPLGEVKVGDEVIGWDPGNSTTKRRCLRKALVVAVHKHRSPIVKLTMESGRVIRCTPDHEWLRARGIYTNKPNGKRYLYLFGTPKVGRGLVHVIDRPPSLSHDDAVEASWLGGIWDGEGSLSNSARSQIVITQSMRINPEVCARIERTLNRLGFPFSYHSEKKFDVDGCRRYALRGNGQGKNGKQHKVNFLAWCRPAKGWKLASAVLKCGFGTEDRIVAIEPDGDGEVVGLTTTTGNYVAWGYASKNCANYVHYKGTDATDRGKHEIKGLEYKRGDSVRLARRMQAEFVDAIITREIEDSEVIAAKVFEWQRKVLEGSIELDDVVVSKRLSRPLDEYSARKKLDGEDFAQLPHIELAKKMQERGEDVGAGTRIAYFVFDGLARPLGCALASDWKGEVDRYYLWEDLVYPPTERLLAAAFPAYDWRQFERVRPKKPRASRKKAEPEEVQATLFKG